MNCCVGEKVTVDLSQIPPHTWDSLSAGTLDLFHSILAQPGGREALEAKKAEIRAARIAMNGGEA